MRVKCFNSNRYELLVGRERGVFVAPSIRRMVHKPLGYRRRQVDTGGFIYDDGCEVPVNVSVSGPYPSSSLIAPWAQRPYVPNVTSLPHQVTFQAIGTVSGILGFRPCR